MARDGIDILTEMLKEMQQTHKVDDQQLESLKALKDLASQSAGSLGGTNNRVQLAPARNTATPNPYGIQGQPAGPPGPNPIPLAPLQHGPAPLPLAPLPGSVPPLNPLKALAPQGPPAAQLVPETPIAPMLAVMHKVSTDVGGILAILQKISVHQGEGGGKKEPKEPKLKKPPKEPGAFDAIIGAFGAVKGAIGAVIGTFNQLTSQISTFVQALAPATVERFGQAMHDLQATVGVALQPLLDIATELTREFGSALLPVMEQLRPILEQLGQAFGSIAKGILRGLVGVFSSLMPALEQLVQLYVAFQPLQEAFNAALVGIIQIIVQTSSVLSLLSGFKFENLTEAFQKLAQSALTAAAYLLKLLSPSTGDKFIKGVIDSLGGGKKKDNTGLGVASNPTISNLESFSKSVNTASLLAGGSAEKKKDPQEKWRNDLLEEMKKLTDSDPQADMQEALEAFWEETAEPALQALVDRLKQQPFDKAKEIIKNGSLGGLAAGAGRLLGF